MNIVCDTLSKFSVTNSSLTGVTEKSQLFKLELLHAGVLRFKF